MQQKILVTLFKHIHIKWKVGQRDGYQTCFFLVFIGSNWKEIIFYGGVKWYTLDQCSGPAGSRTCSPACRMLKRSWGFPTSIDHVPILYGQQLFQKDLDDVIGKKRFLLSNWNSLYAAEYFSILTAHSRYFMMCSFFMCNY